MRKRTVVAFDFGTTSIGVAVGQEFIHCVSALTAFKAKLGLPNWNKVSKLIKDWSPDLIVVGLPLNMDGSEQLTTKKALKFAKCLHVRFGVEVAFHDERLSTVEAKANLFDRAGFRGLNKGCIDSAAAAIILKGWFDCQQQH